MRDLTFPEIDRFRLRDGRTVALYGDVGDGTCGAFLIRGGGVSLRVIASSGEGWDHVSVSVHDRTPTWAEMERVRRLFFHSDEVAMQLHVAEAAHINCHPYTLHIWRPTGSPIPLPPGWMVA